MHSTAESGSPHSLGHRLHSLWPCGKHQERGVSAMPMTFVPGSMQRTGRRGVNRQPPTLLGPIYHPSTWLGCQLQYIKQRVQLEPAVPTPQMPQPRSGKACPPHLSSGAGGPDVSPPPSSKGLLVRITIPSRVDVRSNMIIGSPYPFLRPIQATVGSASVD